MALCDTQHAGKEIVTRPMSEYFANDPECHDLLPCTLRSHRVAGLGGCPTGPPVGGVTSTSTRPCGPVPFAVTVTKGLLNNMVSFFLHKDFKAWRNNFVTFLATSGVV